MSLKPPINPTNSAQAVLDGGPARVVDGGNLGSAYTFDLNGDAVTWLTGTLNANVTITVTNAIAGSHALLLLTQDGTGDRTVTISDGSNTDTVPVATGAGEFSAVRIDCSTASTFYVSSLSVPGPAGPQGSTGATGATGASGGGASFEDPNEFSAVSMDLAVGPTGNSSLTAGVLHLTKVPVTVGFTCNNIVVTVQTAGSGLTSNQCFAGLYDSSGTRVALTADQSASWNSTGDKTMALTAGTALSAGFYWVALLVNFSTSSPTFFRAQTGSMTNTGTAAATARSGTILTAQTSLPASITPGSISRTNPVFAIGLS